jgi:2'-5' RNA ligase
VAGEPACGHEHAAEVRDHWWWRPGWRPGRSFYTWHLLFEERPALHTLVARYQEALAALPGLDLVPIEWLHLTMQGVGFTDEVSKSDVAAIGEAVRRRLAGVAPAVLRFHQVLVRPEAVVLPASPSEVVVRLREEIRLCIAEVWGPDGVPERMEGFTPHVSLAYPNTTASATPILDALHRVTTAPATVGIGSASLIRLERDDRLYHWDTEATVPIGESSQGT